MSNATTFFSFSKDSQVRTLENKIPPQKSVHSQSFEKQANKNVKTECHDMA